MQFVDFSTIANAFIDLQMSFAKQKSVIALQNIGVSLEMVYA